MDSQRHFGILLTTIVKSLFEDGVPTDADSLKQLIYADIEAATPDAIQELFNASRDLISQGATSDLEVTQFEALVQKQKSLSAVQQDLIVKFWKNQKQEIHNNIYKKVMWNNTLQKTAWRIDAKTKTKSAGDINEPTAIVELTIGRTKDPEAQQLVRFEMDRDRLARVLLQINNIQQQISSRAATQ